MIAKNVSKLKHQVMFLFACLSISFVAGDGMLDNALHHYEVNKINKGVWLRHKHKQEEDRTNTGHFFRSNSNENGPNIPFVHGLDVREKRAATSTSSTRNKKNIKGVSKENDSKKTLFNDYPLGVTMLLDNSNNKHIDYNGYTKPATKTALDKKEANKPRDKKASNEEDHLNYLLKDILNITEGNATAKRSMKYDTLVVDRIDLLDMFNKSKEFDKSPNSSGDSAWQPAAVPDKNVYEILPPEIGITKESGMSKPISEKGLIKVLSVLTRTLKKIMKQHNTIKVIHDELNDQNKDLRKKIEVTTKKLNEFDVKYLTIIKLIDKLNAFNDCLKNKEEIFKKKEEIMSKNMVEFENQQNKFIAQQQQFYNIQKMMLMQNEKVNEKQNVISKMQTEISHRQNNFAKILKKVKQTVQNNMSSKLNPGLLGPKVSEKNNSKSDSPTTTKRTFSVDPIKYNLMSLPSNNIIEDQDQMILREKDDKSVDDLIYKYYFNNTFIDTIIKNKILGGIHFGDKTSIARSAKMAAKRNQKPFVKKATEAKTTVLFPVNSISFKRPRRWINHHSTRKHRKRHHSKGHPIIKDNQKHEIFKSTTVPPKPKESDTRLAKDPFSAMATKFCKEIGQSNTKQILDWCVEKAIRRLSNLGTNVMVPPALPLQPIGGSVKTSTVPVVAMTQATREPISVTSALPPLFVKGLNSAVKVPGPKEYHFFPPPLPPTLFDKGLQSARKVPGPNENQFFPDNQELEQNLKEFDLTPDTAGNVYYEGSLHESDILGYKQSEGLSDVLPGYDSNSKVDLDPRLIQVRLSRKHRRAK